MDYRKMVDALEDKVKIFRRSLWSRTARKSTYEETLKIYETASEAFGGGRL